MKFEIDIRNNIFYQFSAQLEVEPIDNCIELPSEFGFGRIELLEFPNQIEVYHFTFNLLEEVEMKSCNPKNSEWLLFNINLSQSKVEKIVNNQTIDIQKYLPSGVLFYTADTTVFSKSPEGKEFELVLVRMHKDFFHQFGYPKIIQLQNSESALFYEDLSFGMEAALKNLITNKQQKIRAAAFLMQFIADIAEKLENREVFKTYEHLHPMDIKGLFLASAHLRNPREKNILSIKELSEIAGMGTTKFKSTFKQVFGLAPIQYHQKIRFEYAKNELESKRKSASELSYELGYSHPSKFTSAFKKIFGELPSSFN